MASFAISIDIDVNSGGVAAGLNPALAAINSFGSSATTAFDKVKSSFAGLSTGTKIFTGLGIGLAGLAIGLKQVVGPAIEFESSFAGVKKTVDGTPQQLESIRAGLLNLSTVLPTSANDLANIAANAGQLGVAAPDVLEFTRVIAALGETTDLDFEQAAQSVARFLNITGNDVPVSRLADVIVELGNNSATTESQIVDFATRLAPTLTLAGAGEDEILALAAAFSSLGQRSEAGGTALSQIFTTLSNAVADGGPKLEEFARVAGLLPEEFREIARTNPVEAFLLFGEGLSRLADEGKSFAPTLETLQLTGERTGQVFKLLASNVDAVRSTLELANGAFTEGGAAQAELDQRLQTTAARLATLGNQLQVVAIAVGTPLLETLADGADLAKEAIASLSDVLAPLGAQLAQSFQGGVEAASQFFSVVGGPALDVASLGLSVLADTAASVLTAINSLGPAGLIIAALVADILLVGPASVAAVAAMQAIAVAGGGMGGALTAANVGLQNLVAGLNPATLLLAALAAAFVFSEGQVRKVDQEVAKFAGTIQDTLATAIETADFDSFAGGLESARTQVVALQESQSGFDKFNLKLNELSGGLLGVDDNARSTRDKIEALNSILESDQIEAYSSNMEFLQNALGFTEDEVVKLLESQGNLNILWDESATRFQPLIAAIEQYTNDVTELDAAQSDAAQNIILGTASLEDYAKVLEITDDTLASVAARLDIPLDAFISEDQTVRAEAFNAVMEELQANVDPIADALNASTDAVEANISATTRLAAAYDELEAALSGAEPPLARIAEQQQAYADASDALAEKLAGGINDQEDLREAMELSQEVTKRLVSSTGDLGAALEFQDIQEDFFREIAADMGIAGDELEDLLNSALLLSGVDLAEISLAFKDLEAAAIDASSAMDEIERERKVNIEAEIDDSFVLKFLDDLGLIPPEVRTELFADGDNGFILEFLDNLGLIPPELQTQLTGSADNGFVLEFLGNLGLIPAVVPVDIIANDAATPVIDDVNSEVAGLTNQLWVVDLSAQDAASAVIQGAEDFANRFKTGNYTADITAENSQALGSVAASVASANSYAGGRYDGQITATNSNALGAIAIAAARAVAYSRTYTATIDARWVGQSAVNAANAALSSVRSRTATITTIQRTVRNSVTQSANGNIVGFDSGGFWGTPEFPNPKIETPGRAGIYQPLTQGRLFAEPETGGEAYIPLGASKRSQGIPVLLEAARIMGVLANGGIQGFRDGGISGRAAAFSSDGPSILFSPAVEVNVSAPGSDSAELASLTEQAVDRALERQARKLTNMR